MIQLLPQITQFKIVVILLNMNLWSLLLLLLFSTELLVSIKCFQHVRIHTDKITFTAFLCLYSELESWVDGLYEC